MQFNREVVHHKWLWLERESPGRRCRRGGGGLQLSSGEGKGFFQGWMGKASVIVRSNCQHTFESPGKRVSMSCCLGQTGLSSGL